MDYIEWFCINHEQLTDYKALILAPNSPCKSWGTVSLMSTQMVSLVYQVEKVHLTMCQSLTPGQHPRGILCCPFWSHSPVQPLFFPLQCWAKNLSSASCVPFKDSLIHSFGRFKVPANKTATEYAVSLPCESSFTRKKTFQIWAGISHKFIPSHNYVVCPFQLGHKYNLNYLLDMELYQMCYAKNS